MGWPEPVRRYLEAWAEAFVEILRQIAAPAARAALVAEESEIARAREDTVNGFRARLGCSGAISGRQRLDVSPAGLKALARIVRGETGEVSAEATAADHDAAAQLLRQVAGQAAARLKAQGGEVEFREEKDDGSEWKPAAAAAIRLEGGAPETIMVVVEIDEALAGALAGRKETGGAVAVGNEAAAAFDDEGSNLDLLLDVELEASIRFGQKELLLKDVLNLRPGAVVELARQVNEPAELLVAGRLMARGEVVVVEGNYGLRITEILGPAERIAAIRG